MISSDNPWIADIRGVSVEEISKWMSQNGIAARTMEVIPPYCEYGTVVFPPKVQVILYSADDVVLFKLTWM
jgi:hypothetical protein